MNKKRRKKKAIRNLVCIGYCGIQLLIVLLLFKGAGKLLEYLGKKDVQEVHSAGIIFGDENDSETEEPLFSVCLDAGHGGKDIGSDLNGVRLEKDDTLALTKLVAEYMVSQNVKVLLTREDDTFLSLAERCEIANTNQVDYLVSLHRNTGEGNGVEIWVRNDKPEESVEMAENILAALEEVGIQRNRGVKNGYTQSDEENYYINSHAEMASCIVELGFMNDAADNSLFDEKKEDYAKAIGDALIATWESQKDSAQGSEGEGGIETPSESETAGDSEIQDETGANTGHTESWPAIENIDSLDATRVDWGLGSNTDEKNRPVDAVAAQEKYKEYQAHFIVEDSDKIYLTFDEGYEYGFSGSILDTLKDKNVKAVFFVTEPYAKEQPELVNRMIAEGHTVGNHSVTHPSSGLPSQSFEQQEFEVMDNHRYVKENFGYEMYLFRYPAGKFNEQSLAIIHNCGYKSVFWSFAYLDYDVNNQPDPLESLKKMTDKLHPGAIYLLHAESQTNAEVLGEFIDRAREAGYEFALFE